jgi:hypothetical protein
VTNTKKNPYHFYHNFDGEKDRVPVIGGDGIKKPETQFLKSSSLFTFLPISIYWVESFTTPVLISLAGHGEKSEDMIHEKEKNFQNKDQKHQ